MITSSCTYSPIWMLIYETHLIHGIFHICRTTLWITKRLEIGIEKLFNNSMASFPDTATPIIERIFGLEIGYK